MAGVIAPVLALGIVSCGEKEPTKVNGEIFQTTIYRGVFAYGSQPLLTPRDMQGTISLTIHEVWGTGLSTTLADPGAAATIDSAVVQIVTGNGRSTFPARFDRATGSLLVSRLPWLNSTMAGGRFQRLNGSIAFIIVPTTDRTLEAYCGTWSGGGPFGAEWGRLSLLIDGATIEGVAVHGDGAQVLIVGSRDAEGRVRMTVPGYTFTGVTSKYAIFGDYEASVDDLRHSGTWTLGPRSF